MRSIAGPNRTRRPRSAKGSIRKGWIRSSGAVLGEFTIGHSDVDTHEKYTLQLSFRGSRKARPEPTNTGSCPVSPDGCSRIQRSSHISTETPREDPLLRVQPILRLVPDHRLWAIDDPGGHLFPALCWQAMHKDSIGLGMRHQVLVNPVRSQHVVAIGASLHPHRYPGIGNNA